MTKETREYLEKCEKITEEFKEICDRIEKLGIIAFLDDTCEIDIDLNKIFLEF